jgi:hypothetical protein
MRWCGEASVARMSERVARMRELARDMRDHRYPAYRHRVRIRATRSLMRATI